MSDNDDDGDSLDDGLSASSSSSDAFEDEVDDNVIDDNDDLDDLADNDDNGDDDSGSSELVEICVESLVGTVFEMRLSKKETISNIKLRLMRLEGIPRHHMHLLYRGKLG